MMNKPAVLLQAQRLADRVQSDVPGDLVKQIDLAYEYTLSRPATELERSIALKIAREQSLAAFTHVLFNLSEFLFMR